MNCHKCDEQIHFVQWGDFFKENPGSKYFKAPTDGWYHSSYFEEHCTNSKAFHHRTAMPSPDARGIQYYCVHCAEPITWRVSDGVWIHRHYLLDRQIMCAAGLTNATPAPEGFQWPQQFASTEEKLPA